METLSKLLFNQCNRFMIEEARPLERYLFENYFVRPCEKDIIRSLGNYQNKDGGFGHGIESDFVLPNSSPMATSVGLRHLSKLDHHEEAMEMIKHGVAYLENTYRAERKGWVTVPEDVNDYAHAPWWTFDTSTGMTIIDKFWGNPSAELIGYLYKYRHQVTRLDVDDLLETAIEHLNETDNFESFHEIYCYIDLYETLPAKQANRIKEKLTVAIGQLVNTNPDDWDTYVAKPLDFIRRSEETFGMAMADIHKNLDYIIKQIRNHGVIKPNWSWREEYEAQWEIAEVEWTGLGTLIALLALDQFNRMDKT